MSTAPRAEGTTSTDPAFRALVGLLDQDLAERNGDANEFYALFNGIAPLQHALVLYDGEAPVGCGAFKPFGDDSVEVKRMYTSPAHRRRGMASQVLRELERWARELGYRSCVLETGLMQPEAIALYEAHGYARIPNYGPYVGIEASVCFEKALG